jgi:hypothetical protein
VRRSGLRLVTGAVFPTVWLRAHVTRAKTFHRCDFQEVCDVQAGSTVAEPFVPPVFLQCR